MGKRAGGRTIAGWKKRAFNELPAGSDAEVAARITAFAREGEYDYECSPELVGRWRAAPPARKAEPAPEPRPGKEPTLADLMAAAEQVSAIRSLLAGARGEASLAGVSGLIEAVEKAVGRVGSFAGLRACLGVIEKIAGLTALNDGK